MFLKTFHIENPSVIVSTSKIESGGRRIVIIGAFIGEAGILVFIKTKICLTPSFPYFAGVFAFAIVS